MTPFLPASFCGGLSTAEITSVGDSTVCGTLSDTVCVSGTVVGTPLSDWTTAGGSSASSSTSRRGELALKFSLEIENSEDVWPIGVGGVRSWPTNDIAAEFSLFSTTVESTASSAAKEHGSQDVQHDALNGPLSSEIDTGSPITRSGRMPGCSLGREGSMSSNPDTSRTLVASRSTESD